MDLLYSSSKLYQQLLKEHTKEEIDLQFHNDIIINKEFIIDHTKIQYNEQNINQYINFALFFQLDITSNFISYVVKEYVLNRLIFLEQISSYIVIYLFKYIS